jgi:hypothetical protein
VKSRDAVRVPVAVGLKTRVATQDAPAPNEVPQLLVSEKSVGSDPPTAICVIAMDVSPELSSRTDLAPLTFPTALLMKFKLLGEIVAASGADGPVEPRELDPVPESPALPQDTNPRQEIVRIKSAKMR